MKAIRKHSLHTSFTISNLQQRPVMRRGQGCHVGGMKTDAQSIYFSITATILSFLMS